MKGYVSTTKCIDIITCARNVYYVDTAVVVFVEV